MRQLGVGAVYSPALHPLFEHSTDLVSVLELEPQMLWRKSHAAKSRYQLDEQAFAAVAALPQQKIVHGVGFPVGGTVAPDPLHVAPLLASIKRIGAEWASEHLSFNVCKSNDGSRQTGFLLPPCQTNEGVAIAARNLRALQRQLSVPFAFETGVNYLKPKPFELSDGEFFRSVAESGDCGILLDLHNLWANECNGRQRVREVLEELPLTRVWEVHLAGGMQEDGFCLDAHSGMVPDEVLLLASEVLPRLPNLSALIFELMPSYVPKLGLDAIAKQLELLQSLWRHRFERADAINAKVEYACAHSSISVRAASPPARVWEYWVSEAIQGRPTVDAPEWIRDDLGVPLLRKLTFDFRSGAIVDALRLTSTLIILTKGASALRNLIESYNRQTEPDFFAHYEAFNFLSFLSSQDLGIPYLNDVLTFERALIVYATDGCSSEVQFQHDPTVILGPLLEGKLPTMPPVGSYRLQIG